MSRPIPSIQSLMFTRIAVAVRDWLSTHDLSNPAGKATEDECNEADADLDAVLRCEARIRNDQAIESIEATDDGVLLVMDDGELIQIRAADGHIRRV